MGAHLACYGRLIGLRKVLFGLRKELLLLSIEMVVQLMLQAVE